MYNNYDNNNMNYKCDFLCLSISVGVKYNTPGQWGQS